jgi:hypothetical protein
MSNICNFHLGGWIVCWWGRSVCGIPFECGIPTSYVPFPLLLCFSQNLFAHIYLHYRVKGQMHSHSFIYTSVRHSLWNGVKNCVRWIFRFVPLSIFAEIRNLRILLCYILRYRESSCSFNPHLHRIGEITRLNCYCPKPSCSIPYGRMHRVISIDTRPSFFFFISFWCLIALMGIPILNPCCNFCFCVFAFCLFLLCLSLKSWCVYIYIL